MKKLDFLPVFTLCFCLGIYLVKLWYIAFTVLYIESGILVVLSLVFLKREESIWLLLILGLLLGGLFLKNSYIFSSAHISKFTAYKSKTVLLKGIVDDYPQVIGTHHTSFVLKAEELTWENKVYRVTGRVLVKVFCKENIFYGQKILLKGRLFNPYGRISDRLSYRDYLRGEHIYSILVVRYNTPIQYLGLTKANPLKTLAYRIRGISRNIYFKHLPATQAGIFFSANLGR